MNEVLLILWIIAGFVIFLNRKSTDVIFWKLEFLFAYLALLGAYLGKWV